MSIDSIHFFSVCTLCWKESFGVVCDDGSELAVSKIGNIHIKIEKKNKIERKKFFFVLWNKPRKNDEKFLSDKKKNEREMSHSRVVSEFKAYQLIM